MSENSRCPVCGQLIPLERVQEAREKALAAFNLSKAERLEAINKRGLSLKDEKDRLEVEIDSLRNISADLTGVKAQLSALITERDRLKALASDFSAVSGRAGLLQRRADIEAEIRAEREGKVEDTEKIKAAIRVYEAQLADVKEKADRFTRREQGEKRIADLMTEEKKLAAEFERLQEELYLCEQFIGTKVSMLTERINSKFEIARFKLFNILVNGGIEECCEITVNGVGYNSGLNSANRTNAGLDIIKTLQRHYGLSCPVFIDNAESVVKLLYPGCQMIRLVVSAEDSVLRVETAKEGAECRAV